MANRQDKIDRRITDILAYAIKDQDPHGSDISLTDFVLLYDNGGELIDQKRYIDTGISFKPLPLGRGRFFQKRREIPVPKSPNKLWTLVRSNMPGLFGNCYKNRILFKGKIFKTLTTYKIHW